MLVKDLEVDFFELDNLPKFERIKKPQRLEDHELFSTPDTKTHPTIINFRAAQTPENRETWKWPKFGRLVNNWKDEYQQILLGLFLLRNGPNSVLRSMKNEFGIVRSSRESTNQRIPEIITYSFGTTFERLAHLELKEKGEGEAIDVGSTQRFCFALRSACDTKIMPDCLIFNNFSVHPTLNAICEFKSNPENPDSLKKLESQISKAAEFLKANKGKIIRLLGTGALLDKKRHLRVKDIRVADNASIIVLIPKGRIYSPTNSFVEVKESTFGPVDIAKITLTILEDIFGEGYVEVDLRIMKEALDRSDDNGAEPPKTVQGWRDFFAARRN